MLLRWEREGNSRANWRRLLAISRDCLLIVVVVGGGGGGGEKMVILCANLIFSNLRTESKRRRFRGEEQVFMLLSVLWR